MVTRTPRNKQVTDSERLERIEDLLQRILIAVSPAGEGPDAPMGCQAKICAYYCHYLRHGPAEMSHTAYHDTERELVELDRKDAEMIANHWKAVHNATDYCTHKVGISAEEFGRLERMLRS
jgi:hypothetical protein